MAASARIAARIRCLRIRGGRHGVPVPPGLGPRRDGRAPRAVAVAALPLLVVSTLAAACGGTHRGGTPPAVSSQVSTAASSSAAAASTPSTPSAASTPSSPAAAPPTVVGTFHGDALRTGWQAGETLLTPAAVAAGLALRWTSPSLGGQVRGQPLYAAHLTVGGAPHDVVYVATEADTVWALDAHTGTPLWGPVRIGTPVPRSALPCGNINPEGITGTPVVDQKRGAVYVVGETTPDGGHTVGFVAAALSLATGHMLAGWPVPIAPAGFDARVQQERAALTLASTPDGTALEVAFGGLWGDCGQYSGWVVQLPLARPAAQAAWRTPARAGAGIWTPGGLADTAQGLFAVTGNSTVSAPGDMGDGVVRLMPGAGGLTQPAGPAGFFAPSNALALDRADRDLGSGGPLALPDQPGPYPHLLFTAGKQGVGYLINRDAPGGNGRGDGVTGEALWSGCLYGNCRDLRQEAVFTTAAYFQGAGGTPYIVTAGQTAQPAPCAGTGGLVAWRLQTATALALQVAWCGPSMADPGSPTVSSDGGRGAVVWAIDSGRPRLLAVDGATGKPLWVAALPAAPRFAVPTVADGQVFVAAGARIVAYGTR